MRGPFLLVFMLALVVQTGCARALQAVLDPGGAASGLGGDTVADLDRILATNPNADNADELRSLREQTGGMPQVSGGGVGIDRVSAVRDHEREHDRQAGPAVRAPADKLSLQSPLYRIRSRGSEDRRPGETSTWIPTLDSTPRRLR